MSNWHEDFGDCPSVEERYPDDEAEYAEWCRAAEQHPDTTDEYYSSVVCGSYAGATPWEVYDDTPPEELAKRLAKEAGCEFYTVNSVCFGPFNDD